MTAHTLPDDPLYAFTSGNDFEDAPQQIRIVFEGMDGYVPTALVALSLDDGERLCDRLNAKRGLDREAWTWPVARSMSAGRADVPPTGLACLAGISRSCINSRKLFAI